MSHSNHKKREANAAESTKFPIFNSCHNQSSFHYDGLVCFSCYFLFVLKESSANNNKTKFNPQINYRGKVPSGSFYRFSQRPFCCFCLFLTQPNQKALYHNFPSDSHFPDTDRKTKKHLRWNSERHTKMFVLRLMKRLQSMLVRKVLMSLNRFPQYFLLLFRLIQKW